MTVGIFNSSATFNPTVYQKKSFAALITRLMPNGQAPVYGISSQLKEETVRNMVRDLCEVAVPINHCYEPADAWPSNLFRHAISALSSTGLSKKGTS